MKWSNRLLKCFTTLNDKDYKLEDYNYAKKVFKKHIVRIWTLYTITL